MVYGSISYTGKAREGAYFVGLGGQLAVTAIFEASLEAIFVRLALWRRFVKVFISVILRATGNLAMANNPVWILLGECIGIIVYLANPACPKVLD